MVGHPDFPNLTFTVDGPPLDEQVKQIFKTALTADKIIGVMVLPQTIRVTYERRGTQFATDFITGTTQW